MDNLLMFLKPLIESLAGSNGKVAQILAAMVMIIGIARTIIKPARALIGAIVEQTKTKSDDEMLAKVESSKAMGMIRFILDFLLSIKLPEKK